MENPSFYVEVSHGDGALMKLGKGSYGGSGVLGSGSLHR